MSAFKELKKMFFFRQINDPTPDYGMSPLHLAIKLENIQVIRKLLDLGAKTSEVDSEGRTAYHYAANCVHSEIIEVILFEISH